MIFYRSRYKIYPILTNNLIVFSLMLDLEKGVEWDLSKLQIQFDPEVTVLLYINYVY